MCLVMTSCNFQQFNSHVRTMKMNKKNSFHSLPHLYCYQCKIAWKRKFCAHAFDDDSPERFQLFFPLWANILLGKQLLCLLNAWRSKYISRKVLTTIFSFIRTNFMTRIYDNAVDHLKTLGENIISTHWRAFYHFSNKDTIKFSVRDMCRKPRKRCEWKFFHYEKF